MKKKTHHKSRFVLDCVKKGKKHNFQKRKAQKKKKIVLYSIRKSFVFSASRFVRFFVYKHEKKYTIFECFTGREKMIVYFKY